LSGGCYRACTNTLHRLHPSSSNPHIINYLGILQKWFVSQLSEQDRTFGASPYFLRSVLEFLNATLLNRWIWIAVTADEDWLEWPPRSPNLTSCDFFLCGYVKTVFLPPHAEEVKLRISAAVENVERNVLEGEWDELD
jgi:hypothetical protein